MSTESIQQVARRRAAAIISRGCGQDHTDRKAAAVFRCSSDSRDSQRKERAANFTSDWMEIEKQRGISVASSVMRFDYREHVINLLDTPGHRDFSEDVIGY